MFKRSRKVLSLVVSLVVFMSMALAAIPAVVAHADTSITLNDPGFENDTVGSPPSGWPGWGGGSGVTVQSDVFHTGNNAVELNGTAWGPYLAYYGMNSQITLTPGEVFTLSCWVYAPAANAIRLYIKNPNVAGSADQMVVYNTEVNTWEQLSITYTTVSPDPTANTQCNIEFGLNLTGTGPAYADDFSLVQLASVQQNTVTFMDSDGTTTLATKSIASSSALGASMPANPTKSGYTFAGWNMAQDGTGIAFTSATTVTADTTVYAQWTTTVPGPTPAPNELLTNTSFDHQSLGTNHDLGGGWYDSNWTTPLTVCTVENTLVNSASGSTQAVAVQAPAYGGFYQFSYLVTPGLTYDLSCWVYRTDENTPTNLQVQAMSGFNFVENGGTLLTDYATQTGQWEQLSVEFTIPAHATSPTVQFGVANNDTPAAPAGGLYPVFYVDDFSLTVVNTAPAGTTYNVTFNNDGVTNVVSAAANTGLGADMPAGPTKAGYTFGGWYTGGPDASGSWFVSGTPVNSDMTVYAFWVPQGISDPQKNMGFEEGVLDQWIPFRSPNPNPSTGYDVHIESDVSGGLVHSGNYAIQCDGRGDWSVGFSRWDLAFQPNTTYLITCWVLAPNSQVRLVANDGGSINQTNTDPGTYSAWTQLSIYYTTYAGQTTFQVGINKTAAGTVWVDDFTCTPVSTVTFVDSLNGTSNSVIVTANTSMGASMPANPTDPTNGGYRFDGWNTAANGSGTAFTSTMNVPANITVYAQWTAIAPLSTVTFMNGSTVYSTKTVVTGNSLGTLMPANPTAYGKVFAGWVDGSNNPVDSMTPITGDTTLTAAWTSGAAQYTTTIQSDDHQVVKGLGGGMPWPVSTSGFPITTNSAAESTLLNMGISVARIYWHNQPDLFDATGTPTAAGNTFIQGAVKEAEWLSQNNIPYVLDGGINNMPLSCYIQQPGAATGVQMLDPNCEAAYIGANMSVLKAIQADAALGNCKMPVVFTPWNEPSAPIGLANGVNTGSMPIDQMIRLTKAMRAAMDAAGMTGVEFGYAQNGEPMYQNYYCGDDIGGSGQFASNAGFGVGWGLFNPAAAVNQGATPEYDSALDAAVGAFTTHSYWTGVSRIQQYLTGYNGTNASHPANQRDNWQTEWCPSSSQMNDYTMTVARTFASDMSFFQFNYWLYWNLWNSSSKPASDAMCGSDAGGIECPSAYYVLQKIMTNITPGQTYVRWLDSTVPGMVTIPSEISSTSMDGGCEMDATSFVSPTKVVVLLCNNTSNLETTSLNGLYGTQAQVWQINGLNTLSNLASTYNQPMTLVASPAIVNGTINYVGLPAGTVTVVVTNGGTTVSSAAPTITSAASASLVSGIGGTFQVTATGSPAPVYTISGAPAGVTIDPATGLITVNSTVAAGTYPITITASNGTSPDATQDFTLTVTPASSEVTVQSATPTASVKKLNGKQNELTITVTELYSDGSKNVIATTLKINNNAAGIYDVGRYKVYVDTKGNTQIRECYIVK